MGEYDEFVDDLEENRETRMPKVDGVPITDGLSEGEPAGAGGSRPLRGNASDPPPSESSVLPVPGFGENVKRTPVRTKMCVHRVPAGAFCKRCD